MNHLKKSIKKEDTIVATVYETYDYDKFKILVGNRDLNKRHIYRLKQSIEKRYLMSPILVNKKWEIIDGQNRYTIVKELGLPLYYIILPDYGLQEVIKLNSNSQNWKKKDFLKSKVELKIPNYLEFQKFMDGFPELGFQTCELLMTLSPSRKSSGGREHGAMLKSFEEGGLEIPDLGKSYDYARRIMKIKQYYDGYNRYSFVVALIKLFECERFDFKEFMEKLDMQPVALKHCVTVIQYRELIEDIYNWKRKNKVSLKY